MDLKVWEVEQRKVSDLIEHERNPRKISEEKLGKLKERILSQGFRTPVCIDNDGVLLAGHQRCKALIDMGLGDMEIPVSIPPVKLTKKLRQEILASDNISMGEFDWQILEEDFDKADLIDWGFDALDKEPKEPDDTDLSDSLQTVFKIEIECRDEMEQEDMFNRFSAEGLKCKILTL